MLELYKKDLESYGCFKDEYPEILKVGIKTVATNAPDRMKAILVATELAVFASNLRKPIMWLGKKIPVNIITFAIAGSGIGKDSSMQGIRASLEPAYEKINDYRIKHAKALAVEAAGLDGKKPDTWRKYYSEPRDLFGGIGTIEGQISHLANLEKGRLGAGYIQVSELGSELQSNKDIAENIKALAIGYDSGYIPAKIVKGDESQVPTIKNLPYNALMFGAPDNIIRDEAVNAKFRDEFSTKLSRRSNIYFYNSDMGPKVFKSTAESKAYRRAINEGPKKAIEQLESYLEQLVDHTTTVPLETSVELEDLFGLYQDYNTWKALEISKQFPMARLHRQHLQWKALKLAGAFAILDGGSEVTIRHYVYAINFTEIFAPHMEAFEIELSKEPYELFCDHMRSVSEKGYASISVHQLKKRGYIKGAGNIQNKLEELVKLAKSYDDVNRYEVATGNIYFYEGEEREEDYGELA